MNLNDSQVYVPDQAVSPPDPVRDDYDDFVEREEWKDFLRDLIHHLEAVQEGLDTMTPYPIRWLPDYIFEHYNGVINHTDALVQLHYLLDDIYASVELAQGGE